MPTWVHEMVHSGGETLTDQLSSAPPSIKRVGARGKIKMAFMASDGTNTATVLAGGIEVIPAGSHATVQPVANLEVNALNFIYQVRARPGAEIDATVVAATASTSVLAIITE